eukprot:snap_masked-scaffold_49-processed-gene-0.31-mRNA-1 protein AED:1.00 eAED:1.00 QI:0/-1/0/0/-1/1/1/0/236
MTVSIHLRNVSNEQKITEIVHRFETENENNESEEDKCIIRHIFGNKNGTYTAFLDFSDEETVQDFIKFIQQLDLKKSKTVKIEKLNKKDLNFGTSQVESEKDEFIPEVCLNICFEPSIPVIKNQPANNFEPVAERLQSDEDFIEYFQPVDKKKIQDIKEEVKENEDSNLASFLNVKLKDPKHRIVVKQKQKMNKKKNLDSEKVKTKQVQKGSEKGKSKGNKKKKSRFRVVSKERAK